MTSNERYTIVGGGLAGARVAETLRAEGFEGTVTLISVESDLPYERPYLSKEYLQGTEARDYGFVHDRAWYDEQKIDLRLGEMVTGLDLRAREVLLEGGERVSYDKLALGTGSWPRRIDIPGADLDGVLYLRDLPEADAIKQVIDNGGPLVIVGAGWIGMEVAAEARQKGVAVTVLEAAELPLQRVLGDEVAEIFARLHREHGVDLRLGVGIREIVGSDGKVSGVIDANGDTIDTTAVLVGIGAVPQVDWIAASGVEVDGGVLVDASLRSSDPAVYAVGDIAAIDHPVLKRRVRVEHWAMANDSGPVAAKAMLGQDAVVDFLPFFYSDQYDVGLEYVGYVEPGEADQVVVRGDVAGHEFMAFWLVDRTVRAGMHVNMWDDGIDSIKALVGRQVDPIRLADPAVPLSDL